jgi:hypothetical protein
VKLFTAVLLSLFIAASATRMIAADVAPSKSDVLKAINTFQMEPTSKDGFAASSTIMAFASKSPAVHISISKAVIPWIKDKDASDADTRNILLAAYVAGNVEAQLKSGHAVDDVYSGWEQVFTTYAQILHINSAAKIEEVDELREKDEHGELRAYAAEVSSKGT